MTAVQFGFRLNLPFYLGLPDAVFVGRRGRSSYGISTVAKFETVGTAPHEPNTSRFAFDADGKLVEAFGVDIPGAMLRYTQITIRFSRDVDGAPPVDEPETRKARDSALRALNHFLDVYRFHAGDPRVRRISRTEFHHVRALQALVAQTDVRAEGKGEFSFGIMPDESDPIVAGVPAMLAEDVVGAIRTLFERGGSPVLPVTLLLNAQSHLREANPKLAVIDAAMALDITVENKALEILVGDGVSAAQAQARLERLGTTRIIKELIRPRVIKGVVPDPPWDEWIDRHRVLRNRVVHDGYEPTHDEAEGCRALAARLESFVRNLAVQDPGSEGKPSA